MSSNSSADLKECSDARVAIDEVGDGIQTRVSLSEPAVTNVSSSDPIYSMWNMYIINIKLLIRDLKYKFTINMWYLSNFLNVQFYLFQAVLSIIHTVQGLLKSDDTSLGFNWWRKSLFFKLIFKIIILYN